MQSTFRMRSLLSGLVMLGLSASQSVYAEGYGTLKGRFVINGSIPKLKLKVQKGDPEAKDPACCAAQNVPNDELQINPKNNGIKDVFVFIKKISKSDIHPDLKKSKEKEVVFDQKGCRFIPHAMVVRTDQVVRVKSDDNIQHNTHTYSVLNKGENFIIDPNNRVGIVMPKFFIKEFLPIEVKCDIHPWMKAWWCIIDHPYAVLSDKDGNFEMKNIPAGEYEFLMWHSITGYVFEKDEDGKQIKGMTLTIGADKTKDVGDVKVNEARFVKNLKNYLAVK